MNAAATGTAKRKAIKNIDPQLLPYILFYRGELKPYKEALDFRKERHSLFSSCWTPTGKIIHATSGKFTTAKMDDVEAVLE